MEESKLLQKVLKQKDYNFNIMHNNNNRNQQNGPREESEFTETVVRISRVSKKTKGGNQMRFTALVVVGDRKGKVGAALEKAPDVRSAIMKASSHAKAHMIKAPIKGTTIPHDIKMKFNAARILIKPAPPGSGIIAGGPMRVVLEAAGIRDAVGKILGTSNKVSNVYATINALEELNRIMKTKKAR